MAPYLRTLLSLPDEAEISGYAEMDSRVKRRRTLDALKQLFLRESLNQPLVIVFEDLHWIDNESQEFLNTIVDSIANARILLLANYALNIGRMG